VADKAPALVEMVQQTVLLIHQREQEDETIKGDIHLNL